MKLKSIKIIAILGVLLLVIVSLILTYLNKIAFLESLEIIIAGVPVISFFYIVINKLIGDKVKKIDDQINYIYSPLVDIIENFQKQRGLTSYSSEVIEDISELQRAFHELEDKIKTRTPYKIDNKIWEAKRKFVAHKSNTNDNLNTFLNDIKHKMTELQDEKKKYI
jgi:hypothetical protein